MKSAESDGSLDHPSFVTAGGTVAAYVLIVLGMTILLFGVPFVLFRLF